MPVVLVGSQDASKCLLLSDLRLERIDSPQLTRGEVLRDSESDQLLLLASEPGLYRLVDTNGHVSIDGESLYFGDSLGSPDLVLPRACREVHRLSPSHWACNEAVLGADGELVSNSALRWLRWAPDSVLAARRDGIWLQPVEALESDSGTLVTSAGEVIAWTADEGGFSFLDASGVTDCVRESNGSPPACTFIGGLHRPVESPPEWHDYRVTGLFRRGGNVYYSYAVSETAYCDVGSASCGGQGYGHVVAATHDSIWAAFPLIDLNRPQFIASEFRWNGGWLESENTFTGPSQFGLISRGEMGVTGERLVYFREGRFFVVDLEAYSSGLFGFEILDAPDWSPDGGIGVTSDFFWLSFEQDSPRTEIFFRAK